MDERNRHRTVALGAAGLLAFGCTHGEPPTSKIDGSIAPIASTASIAPIASNGAAVAAPQTPPAAASNVVAVPVVDAGARDSIAAPDDVGEQTKDKPSIESAAFKARMKALFDAVVEDKPEIARGAFFPVKAYEKVKAVGNPAGDWRVRLLAAYERDIHDLHIQMGARTSRAKYVGIEVPEERGRWVEPGEEYNKLGYWRVFGSRIKYDVDGHERSFLVKSLISWRGEYYVVHLSGMK